MKKQLFLDIIQTLTESEQVEVTLFPPVRQSLFKHTLKGEFVKKQGLFLVLQVTDRPQPLLVNYLRIVTIEKIDKT